MRKRFLALAGTIVITAAMMFTGCGGRTVGVSTGASASEKETTGKKSEDEEETTKKSSKKDDEEEETTKKSSKKDDEETTKKSSKKDEEETTKKSSKKDEEETTKKSSKDSGSSTAPSGWTQYKGSGFSVYIDEKEWTKTSLAGSELAFTHLGTATNGFTENINVITQDTSAYKIDLEGYKDLSLEQYDQLGYEVESIENMAVNGVDGYYIVTSTVQSGTTCYIAQYFTLVDDTAYVFTFAADEDDFDDLESEAVLIFSTIEFE